MATGRQPTPAQVGLLRDVDAGNVVGVFLPNSQPGARTAGWWSYFVVGSVIPQSKQLCQLILEGWAQHGDEYQSGASREVHVELTAAGQAALAGTRTETRS